MVCLSSIVTPNIVNKTREPLVAVGFTLDLRFTLFERQQVSPEPSPLVVELLFQIQDTLLQREAVMLGEQAREVQEPMICTKDLGLELMLAMRRHSRTRECETVDHRDVGLGARE